MKMFRKLTLTAATALALTTGQVMAAEVETEIEDFAFSFEGPFGSYDQMQLQRGLQIYTEICSACHGLEFVAFRTLHDEGGPELPEDQMRAYAEFYEVYDETIDDYRAATPADKFPAVTGASAPDLSLMAKSRAGFHGPMGSGINQLVKGMGGAEYIASILAGYHEAPECAPEDFDGYYNVAFAPGGYPEECLDDHGHRTVPGSWIGMAPPLWGDDVEFADGHSTELHHEAQDVAAFLMWTAEPKMMARKQAGLSGVVLLIMLSVLLYLTNKRLWAPHKHKD
ncbi:cytochrome c1 [Loktanella sp. S4079]|uniref:cytochrome c1 n=1 Tax=Loktanella sp. S4079 TaxID=579483 RepID=UPI0005F9B9C4|nr:cytochrome c1 [Loktanella sp. S4079]KJZ19449.1 cytochrome C [Loktanella sp. S4079]